MAFKIGRWQQFIALLFSHAVRSQGQRFIRTTKRNQPVRFGGISVTLLCDHIRERLLALELGEPAAQLVSVPDTERTATICTRFLHLEHTIKVRRQFIQASIKVTAKKTASKAPNCLILSALSLSGVGLRNIREGFKDNNQQLALFLRDSRGSRVSSFAQRSSRGCNR